MHFPRRPQVDTDERILPLINVVFLLLIFFILAGQLSAADPFEIDPARSASETQPDEPDLTLYMGPDGALALNRETMDAAALEQALSAAVETRKAAGETPPRLWLKADANTEATALVEMLQTVRGVGIETLKLVTVMDAP